MQIKLHEIPLYITAAGQYLSQRLGQTMEGEEDGGQTDSVRRRLRRDVSWKRGADIEGD